jgi:hypothetical protein
MTQQTDTQGHAPETNKAQALSDPNISFADYQTLRRGGTVPAASSESSAPTPETGKEQKKAPESEPEGKGTESEGNEGTDDLEASEAEGESEGKGKTQGKKGGGFQKRISKLTADKANLARELEYWKSVATQSKGQPDSKSTAEPAAPKPDAKTEGKPRPKPGDFETYAEFQKAEEAWLDERVESKFAERERKQKDSEAKNAKVSSERAFAERVKAFAEKNQDYHDVITEAREQNLFVSETMGQVILDSENGPAIFYALAKNPSEGARIGSLPPHRQMMEMGKIEARITQAQSVPEKKPETKQTTQAPKPVDPVGTGKGTSAGKSITDPDISFPDYVRARREQMKRKRA